MPKYQAPLRDMKFLLNEVLEIGSYSNLPRFADAPADVIDAVLDGGAKFASEVLQIRNGAGRAFRALFQCHSSRCAPPPTWRSQCIRV